MDANAREWGETGVIQMLRADWRAGTRVCMKSSRIFKTVFATSAAIVATALSSESKPGRVSLWNGRDLSGWTVFLADASVAPGAVWNVKDGVLRLDTKVNGYIRTGKTFSDYHLHVEWRWPAGAAANSNSGVLLHVTGEDAVWPKCFEAQLRTGNAGQVVGMGMDIPGAPVLNNRTRAPRLAEPSEKPLGEWNAYDIHARGDSIEVLVNGVRQNFVEKLPVSAGSIALQMEGHPIEFRNVWIEPAR